MPCLNVQKSGTLNVMEFCKPLICGLSFQLYALKYKKMYIRVKERYCGSCPMALSERADTRAVAYIPICSQMQLYCFSSNVPFLELHYPLMVWNAEIGFCTRCIIKLQKR
jgi:hypothetical protein